ncbi:MAG TPA: D-alanyl-D-alanine carboxypeptidase [Pyrinomonadaceae bacterium]|jgi:D-alanyl-D-alanine carboxypeptidase/D-alanyl-D-alanine-endopeptidase (penicillin-binding protein 4)|nr:D-alanyl-D-alanine carboxypeptidase [Pyrinomonadaceae bacterium]
MARNRFRQLIITLGLLLAPVASATAQENTEAVVLSRQGTPVEVPAAPPVSLTHEPPVGVEDVPTLAQIPVALRQGVLVETLNGTTVMAQGTEQGFNPASAVKLATALTALRTLGPQHRFSTAIWTTGTFDATTGTVTGDLVVSGRDPSFHDEHAVLLARELNRLGIRTVTGDLVVAPRFTMNFSPSSVRSGERLYDTLDATRRPASATRAWYESRAAVGDTSNLVNAPSVAVMGAVYVSSVPSGAKMIVTHKSSPLIDILKVLLCYSNNFMAERLGDSLGGPDGVRRFLVQDVGLPEGEVRLASTSGLGVNRLTPRGMLKIYRALREELSESGHTPADIMPVAGIDPGTLERRYRFSAGRGSIIAKTGTLIRTDGGASALVGQFRTQSGETLLFVIFNQRGSVVRFRDAQDRIIADLQAARGGPAPFVYSPHALAMRLVDTELDPAKPASKDEYEPIAN